MSESEHFVSSLEKVRNKSKLKIFHILRPMLLFSFRQLRSFTSSPILSSKNEDETDKPIENDGEKNKKEELTSKLNSLLQTMVQVV